MSIGCPLVATGARALPEIIQDGINGLLCRTDDQGDLAAKMSFLLDGPAAAEHLGHQAAVDCRQRYSSGLLAARSADYHQRRARIGAYEGLTCSAARPGRRATANSDVPVRSRPARARRRSWKKARRSAQGIGQGGSLR